MAVDLPENLTDEERAVALGMSLTDFLSYRQKVIKGIEVGARAVAKMGMTAVPIVVHLNDENEVVKIEQK